MWYVKNRLGEYLSAIFNGSFFWGPRSKAMKLTDQDKEYYGNYLKEVTYEEV